MAFLKPNLPEAQTVTLTMVKRGPVNPSGQYGPTYRYQINWAGEMFDHDATQTEEKKLQNVPEGTELNVLKEKNSYGQFSLYWNLAGGGNITATRKVAPRTMEATPGNQVPPASITLPNPVPPKQPDWDAIAVSKIMHNFVRDAYMKGVNMEACANVAAELYEAQLEAVKLAAPKKPQDEGEGGYIEHLLATEISSSDQ